MRESRRFLVLFPLVLIFIIAQCAKKENVVARLGIYDAITAQELLDYRQSIHRGTPLEAETVEGLRDALDQLIDRKIKLMVAREQGMATDSSIVKALDSKRPNFMLQQMYENEIADRVVSEREIRDYYANTGKSVVVRSIFFKVNRNASPEEEAQIKARALEVLEKVNNGEDFAKLAAQNSEDRKTGANGGLIGTLTWTTINDPIRNEAFRMNTGETSGLIRNNVGFNIIRVDQVNHVERKPYSEMRDSIRRNILKEKSQELNRVSQAFIDDVFENEGTTFYDGNINRFWEIMKGVDNPQVRVILDTLAVLPDSLLEKPMCEWKGGSITIADFRDKLKSAPAHAVIPKDIPDRYKNIIKRWLTSDFLMKEARHKKLDNHPEVVAKMEQEEEKLLLSRLNRTVIDPAIAPSSEEIRAFYEKHKEEKYRADNEIRPLDEISERVKNDLMRLERKDRTQAWCRKQRENYDVHIDNQALLSLLEDSSDS